MSDKKISQLTAAAALTGTEIVPIIQSGNTVRTTAQDIADLGGGVASYREYYGTIHIVGVTPTVNEFENTIGSPLTFLQSSTGVYIISFGLETFNPLKVFSVANSGVAGAANLKVIGGGPDFGKFMLHTYDTNGALANIQGNATCVNIRVYP